MSFFVLTNRKSTEVRGVTDFEPVEPVHTGDAPRCQSCDNAIGMLRWLPPCHADLELWGQTASDIAFGPGNELLVSDSFRALYEEHGLTGLSGFHPVQLHRTKMRSRDRMPSIPHYCCVYVPHSAAVIDERASGLERDRPRTCSECRLGGIVKRIRRVCLVPRTWPGEDIFFATGLPGVIIVSEAFARLGQELGTIRQMLVPADEYAFDSYPWEKT